jgi:hypothetical protein
MAGVDSVFVRSFSSLKMKRYNRPLKSKGLFSGRDYLVYQSKHDSFRHKQLFTSTPKRIVIVRGNTQVITKDLLVSSFNEPLVSSFNEPSSTVLSSGTSGVLLPALALLITPSVSCFGAINYSFDHVVRLNWIQLSFFPRHALSSRVSSTPILDNVSEIAFQLDSVGSDQSTFSYSSQGYDRQDKKVLANSETLFSIAFSPCVLDQLQILPGYFSATLQPLVMQFCDVPISSLSSSEKIFSAQFGVISYVVTCTTSVSYDT